MTWYTKEDRITLEEVADFFDLVEDEELLTTFNFQKRDGTLVTVKDKFKAYFYGLQCRFIRNRDEDIAKVRFLTIFEDSILDLLKIKRYKEQILKDLQNFNLYQDEVITTHAGNSTANTTSNSTSNQNNALERNLIEGSLMGSSSASTMSSSRDKTLKTIESRTILEKSENKLLDYLDPNTKDVQQTVSLYKGGETTTIAQNSNSTSNMSGTSASNSKSASSNPFKDRVEFLRLKIPALTSDYFENFRILFLC